MFAESSKYQAQLELSTSANIFSSLQGGAAAPETPKTPAPDSPSKARTSSNTAMSPLEQLASTLLSRGFYAEALACTRHVRAEQTASQLNKQIRSTADAAETKQYAAPPPCCYFANWIGAACARSWMRRASRWCLEK